MSALAFSHRNSFVFGRITSRFSQITRSLFILFFLLRLRWMRLEKKMLVFLVKFFAWNSMQAL